MKPFYALLVLLLLAACKPATVSRHNSRSMYYWSTTFRIDSTEARFLRSHGVGRLYVRYFDVVTAASGDAVPNATIAFRSAVPGGVEVVPVVYIMNDCLLRDLSQLPERIVKRVLQMNETNDVAGVRELQIDCDWTMRTQQRFFDFLQRLRQLVRQHGLALSATIRLHQLTQPVPPVDRGVLMVYNTGNVADITDRHPILDIAAVRPYLRNLPAYRLRLSAAYPLYTWKVLYRGGVFVGIVHKDGEYPVMAGDTVIERRPEMEQIIAAREAIGHLRPDVHDEVLLFDLSRRNIERFKPADYETIFSR